jgi:hypothetical protein
MNPARALVLLSVAALLTSCATDPTRQSDTGAPKFAGGGSGPSASGHVEQDIEGCCLEKYSFDAHYLGDGSVHGRFNIRDFFTDGSEKAWAKGRVTCFTVEADGKTARMGGVVESASDPVVGTEAIWTVRDNGEGENDPGDQATDLIYGIPPRFNAAQRHCTPPGFPPGAFNKFGALARANVQVRP